MVLIRDVVQQAVATGYLTFEAEEKLRSLLRTKYDSKDLDAFMLLQQAVMSGSVRQESRERRISSRQKVLANAS
jgi:hypothetical protein